MHAPTRQRRRQLLGLLRQDTVLSVRHLSEQLGVSDLTIRRDLDALQAKGLVERLHGGAHLLQSAAREMDKHEISFYIRQGIASEEKRAISRAACRFLEQDQVVFLDASTTALCLVQILPEDLSLTIVTHSAYLPIELAGRTNLQVISTGGMFHPTSLCYLGSDAENRLRQFHAHRAFLGVKGLTPTEGCTDANRLEVQLKTQMVQQAREVIILADHNKLGNIGLSSFATLGEVSILITDEKADSKLIEAIRGLGVEVILAPPAS